HTQPFQAQPQCRPGPGRGRPWRARHRSAGRADSDEGRECQGAGCPSVRADGERDEGHGDAPLEVEERHASATPPSEVLAEQGSSSPQYERTVSRQVGAGSSTLRADQEPGGPGRNQHVAGTPDPPVRGTAVESPSLYDALAVPVAPDPVAPAAARGTDVRQPAARCPARPA